MSDDEVTLAVLAEPDSLVNENARLRGEIEGLRRQLRYANERNHERNLQLDALHMVWCDGGCERGAHRWSDKPLTWDHVLFLTQQLARMERWLRAHEFRAARRAGDNSSCATEVGAS